MLTLLGEPNIQIQVFHVLLFKLGYGLEEFPHIMTPLFNLLGIDSSHQPLEHLEVVLQISLGWHRDVWSSLTTVLFELEPAALQ